MSSSEDEEERKVLIANLNLLQEEVNKRIEELKKRVLNQSIVTERDKEIPTVTITKESETKEEESIITIEQLHREIAAKKDLDKYFNGFILKAKVLKIFDAQKPSQPQKAMIIDQDTQSLFMVANWHKNNLFLRRMINTTVILDKVYLKRIFSFLNKDCPTFNGRWNEDTKSYTKIQYEIHSQKDFEIR